MDYGFPPGGLERLFASYDRIVSRGVHAQNQQKNQEEDGPREGPKPTVPPPGEPAEEREEPYLAAERADAHRKEVLGYSPDQSWGDIAASDHQEAEKRLKVNGASFEQDERGLEQAYKDTTAPGVYYDPDTRTEYIKGSITGRDWYDDFTKIPAWGDTTKSERYEQANSAYTNLQNAGKPVDRVVGHSLGGSVALEMQSQHGIPRSRTFGAPVLDLNPQGKVERYRHPLDPVDILDRKASWGSLKAYSHSHTGFTR